MLKIGRSFNLFLLGDFLIKVLVVDDSAFMRKVVRDLLTKEKQISVVGEADNGFNGIKQTLALKPDVVVMDLQMPFMDGLKALQKIMEEQPTPVIILSAFVEQDSETAVACLEAGAIDLVQKPGGPVTLDLDNIKEELIKKVLEAAKAKVKKINCEVQKPCFLKKDFGKLPAAKKVVVVASSTGGPSALEQLFSQLPPTPGAGFIIIQHMPMFFTSSFALRLNNHSGICIKEAEQGEIVKENIGLVAPGGKHLEIKNKTVFLTDSAPENGVKPSANVTLKSAAKEYGEKVIGVILTGMGEDGLEGMRAVKKAGGKVIAQDKETSVVYGMPMEVAKAGLADFILPLEKISEKIGELIKKI